VTGTASVRLGRTIYGADQIAQAVERLASEIARDYAGQPLVLLGVLKGALYFTTDLSRALAAVAGGPSEIIVEYACVTSYGENAVSNGKPRILLGADTPVEGRKVLVVDDIADNGLTLEALGAFLESRGGVAPRFCVLFDKPIGRPATVRLDYAGLPVPDTFVVGYGLDYQEVYRTLPYLAELNFADAAAAH
jgi:hypoxanthine phosphoribosyltransferase